MTLVDSVRLVTIKLVSRVRPAYVSQVTAIFLSFAPLWSLCVALYKYPSLRRRQERRRKRQLASRQEAGSQHSDEDHDLLSRFGHSPQISGTAESFEMNEMGPPEILNVSSRNSGPRHYTRNVGNNNVNTYVVTLPGSDTGLLPWVRDYQVEHSHT